MRRTKAEWRERLVLGVIHMTGVLEALVFFTTLSFWSLDISAKVVFSDWADNFIEGKKK